MLRCCSRAFWKTWGWFHLNVTVINAVSMMLQPSYLSYLKSSIEDTVNVCWGTNVKPAHTHTLTHTLCLSLSHTHTHPHTHCTTYLDVKLVGSGFMVSYSIILLCRALVRAVLGRVRWSMMCHCSPNPIFSSPLIGALCFLLSVHDLTPRRKHCSPTFFLWLNLRQAS